LVSGLKDPIVDVRLRVHDYAPVFLRHVKVKGSSRAHPVVRTLKLDPGGAVFGEIVYGQGVSLPPGSHLVAWPAKAPLYVLAFHVGLGQLPHLEDLAFQAQRIKASAREPRQDFELAGLLPGSYRLAVLPPGRLPQLMSKPMEFMLAGSERVGPLRVLVRKQAAVEVRVTMLGIPIPCFAELVPMEGAGLRYRWRQRVMTPNARGLVRFEGVFPGTYKLKVSDGGAFVDRLCKRNKIWWPMDVDGLLNGFFKLSLRGRQVFKVGKEDVDLGMISLEKGIAAHRRWIREVGRAYAQHQADMLETFTTATLREAGLDEKWLMDLIIEKEFSMSLASLKPGDKELASRMKENPYFPKMLKAIRQRDFKSYLVNFRYALEHAALSKQSQH